MKFLILSSCLMVGAAVLIARAATPTPTIVFTQKIMPESVSNERGAQITVQYMSDGSVRWTRAGR